MTLSQNAKALIDLRNWADTHLPTYRSRICDDLALTVLSEADQDAPVALKKLYRMLPYSEAHLRRQLRRLEDDSWVQMKPHPIDARNRFIEPTSKMLQAYREYFLLYLTLASKISGSFKAQQL